jgi:hypothetical protein
MTMYPPMPTTPPNPPRRRKQNVQKAITALVLVAGGVFALTYRHADAKADDPGRVLGDTGDPFVAACIDSWNNNNENKLTDAATVLAGQNTPDPHAYVSVGPAATFPDKCLITIANSTTQFVVQYLEQDGNTWTYPAGSGSVSDLPASVTNWNAQIGQDGDIHQQ